MQNNIKLQFVILTILSLTLVSCSDSTSDREHPGLVPTADENVLDEAKQLLEGARYKKFFGWIHFISPHTPYNHREISAHLAGPQDEGRFAETTGGKFEVETPEELSRVRDLYDGQIYFGDHLCG